MGWLQDFFYDVYNNIEDGVTSSARWVGEKAESAYTAVSETAGAVVGKMSDALEAVIDGTVASAMWIYEALQGDWNDDRTPAQIAADSVLSMVPIIDQIFDLRDLIANCKKLTEDISDKWVWLSLCLCIIGLIPTFGSLAKGVLKIIVVYIKRVCKVVGGKAVIRVPKELVEQAVKSGLDTVNIFLTNEKVVKVLKTFDLSKSYKKAADGIREQISKIEAGYFISLFNARMEDFKLIIIKLNRILPEKYINDLKNKYNTLHYIASKMGQYIDDALSPLRHLVGDVADSLDNYAMAMSGGGAKGLGNAKNTTIVGDARLKVGDMPGGNTLLKPQELMDELARRGVKYNPEDVIMVTKTPDGTLLWLEKGNARAGLEHIVNGHADDLAAKGIKDIPGFIQETLQTKPINIGQDARGCFADYLVNGNTYRAAYGTNGFIVSFYPK